MQVTISATSIGGNAGPFAIYQNSDSYTTPVATGITRSQILSGYVVTLDNTTTTVRLTSSGTCTNSTDISVVSPSPTPTPTMTPTPTPSPVRTVYWSAGLAGCSGMTYQIIKNSNTISSGGTDANGSFTVVPGDVITVNNTTGPKATGLCTTANALIGTSAGGGEYASDSQTGVGVTATATYTITSGTASTIYMDAGLSV